MTHKDARKLKAGDRIVIWPNTDDSCEGTVAKVNALSVITKWDDGQIGIIHIDDHQDVHRL